MKFQDALNRLRTIAETLPEDDPDKQEMLAVEGDYQSLMEWALRKRNESLANAESCAGLKELYQFREKRFENKAEGMKDVVRLIMNAAGEKKYQGIAATASIREVPPKPIVLDESKIPEDYFETKRTLQKALVNQAIKDGYEVPGVGLDNGGETISIRSK